MQGMTNYVFFFPRHFYLYSLISDLAQEQFQVFVLF